MKAKYTPLLFLFILFNAVFAQERTPELPQVIPPSPTVANLMQFEEVPVSNYTGQPNISIPLYNRALSQDISLALSLSYNTQSVKINNRSGWTGTGWSLNAGGVISRTVRGIADDQKNSSQFVGTGVFHNDDFWIFNILSKYDTQEFLWRSNGTPLDKYDHEIDLFQFNALGISGRFIIVKENGLLVPKLLTKNSSFKIDVQYGVTGNPYKLTSFTITDTKGNTYFFEEQEIITTAAVTGVEYHGNFGGDIVESSPAMNVTNAWHLSKIETSTGEELVSFVYQDSYENYISNISRMDTRPIPLEASNLYNYVQDQYNASVLPPRKSYTYSNTTLETQKSYQKLILEMVHR
jgi:hypothetical protein